MSVLIPEEKAPCRRRTRRTHVADAACARLGMLHLLAKAYVSERLSVMIEQGNARTSMLKVRMNDGEIQTLDAKCEVSGLSRSKYVRQSLIGGINDGADDIIVESISPQNVHRDLDYFSALVEMLESNNHTFRGWVNNIKDDAKRISTLPYELAKNECEQVLRALIGCVGNYSQHAVEGNDALLLMHVSTSELAKAYMDADDYSLAQAVALVEYAHAVVDDHCEDEFDQSLFWNSMARVMVKKSK